MDSAEHTGPASGDLLQKHEESLSSLSRQLAASEQWAGRVNETLSAIQETLARLVPPTAPVVPAPPPVPSASLSVGSVRDPAPPALVPFTGELGRCGGFLIQVSLLFQRYPQAFSNDAVKISHVIGALRDRALDWAESYLALHPVETVTYEQFVQDFKAVFHHPLRSDEAARQLHGLRQGGRSVAEFSIDFRVKAAETGWGEDALRGAFVIGLDDRMKDELATRDEPESFEALVNLAIRIDNRLRERERERGGRVCAGSAERAAVRTIFRPPPPGPARARSPPASAAEEPMQLGRTRLTLEERRRRFEGRLCLYCGQSGHFVSTCPLRSKGGAHQ